MFKNKNGKTEYVCTKNGNVLKAVIFVCLFMFFLTALSYMVRGNGDTKNRFMGFYAEPNNSIDVVMIGSSPTYSCISSPQMFGEYGIKAYPLASNIQRPVAGMYLVREARKSQNPVLYIFEMRMYAGIEEGFISNMAYTRDVTDNMKYSVNRIQMINAMVSDKSERLSYYFDIFKYHSNWKMLVFPDQWASAFYLRNNPSKGYTITDKVGPSDPPVVEADAAPAPLDVHQEKALVDLLDYLQANGLNALFYVAPYAVKEGDEAKYATMREMVNACGYEFLDLNQYYDEIGIDFYKDFSDYGIHTNAVGAEKCTEFMGKYLRDNYELPNHLTDKGRGDASWQKSYDSWQKAYSDAVGVIEQRIIDEDWAVIEE